MLIQDNSKYYLKKIRAKAKMYEYEVPTDSHIQVEEQANDLILLSIGIVGDVANEILNMEQAPIILSKEKEEELYFVSRFFDSYSHAKLYIDMNPYFILMGAVTYYFCNMNGSSKVMMNSMSCSSGFEFSASGLENVITWLLDDINTIDFNVIDEKYRKYIKELVDYHDMFFRCEDPVEPHFKDFRECVYCYGNSREILFTDIILAIIKKKIHNSNIILMPIYSEVNRTEWIPTFKNNLLMKEMWTSQILLGEKGIFKGKSGVIQMPTSSGKTTSISLAIQSAFLSKRTSLVIVVAPFRALCKEIMFDMESFFAFDENITVTEFSDIPERSEVEVAMSESITKKIIIMTPEKLAYILKHNTGIIEDINMIVFDEAHLFDDESRGTDYELLLTTINYYLKTDAQKILVSAVISNAEQLNSWINRDGIVITNNSIKTSEKTIAFNSFLSTNNTGTNANLYFVNPNKNLEEEFFVPRVVQIEELKKSGRERNQRYFPDLENHKQDIGIFYAIKLIKNGSIAIYCAKKDTVNTVLSRFIELKNRGISIDAFRDSSDMTECSKIAFLIKEHMGENNFYTAALNGIIGHHSGIPNGVRVAEEYALKKSLVRCVVCTSTLSQGVNLPIKYLIVSNVYPSNRIIRVRDFHNLIGRTARAGKETEGTIILTENVYKGKNDYKLEKYKRLLDNRNAEDCSSNLLKLVRIINLDNGESISVDFLETYFISRYSEYEKYASFKKNILIDKKNNKDNGKEIIYKINEIESILISLENFILNFEDVGDDNFEIIQSTYGYYLANEEERKKLKDIYKLIKNNIDTLKSFEKSVYKQSMLGILKMKELTKFIDDNLDYIENADFNTIIEIIINNLKEQNNCKTIPKIIDNSYTGELLKMWLDGNSYLQILEFAKSVSVLMKKGKSSRDILLEDVISLCDSDFAFASLAIIQALIEIISTKNCSEEIQEILNDIICRIRYGLPNKVDIFIYELGFADRIISQKIADVISCLDCSTKNKTKTAIRNNRETILEILVEYPSYFTNRLKKICYSKK